MRKRNLGLLLSAMMICCLPSVGASAEPLTTDSKAVSSLSASSGLEVKVNSVDSIQLTVNTPSIDFTGYSGVKDLDNSEVVVNVSSSLNYDLTVQMDNDFASTSGDTLKSSNLAVKLDSQSESSYVGLERGKAITLASNAIKGTKDYNLNLRLLADSSVNAGNYTGSIYLKAIQK